jgi:hypothetical protein
MKVSGQWLAIMALLILLSFCLGLHVGHKDCAQSQPTQAMRTNYTGAFHQI